MFVLSCFMKCLNTDKFLLFIELKATVNYVSHVSHINGVVVNMLAFRLVDHGFEPLSVQTKNYYKLVFVASPLSIVLH